MGETSTVAFFIVGNLIGAGFFMMPATVAHLGLNLIWSWAAGATVALTFALIFGSLYKFYPKSETLADYFDNFPLKQTVAILYWIGAIVGNVVLLTMVLAALKPSSFKVSLIGAFFVMLILTLINHYLSYEAVKVIEILLSMMKFSLLIFLPLFIFISNPSKVTLPAAQGNFSDIAKIGAMSFWSFLGIETAGVFGKGKAARNGLLIGIISCFILYVLSCFLIVGSVPLETLQSSKEIPLVYLVKFSNYPYLSKYVSLLISFTCFGALYGWVAATSKMSLSYAKENLFSKVFLIPTKSNNSLIGLWSSSIITYLIYFFVGSFNVDVQFNIIADFCVNITLSIFCLCAMVLFLKTESIFEKLLSAFGVLFLVFLLSMSVKYSIISIILFFITLAVTNLLN
ncbi:APC family permease [Alphaproteobacteria bacterium endosymbiont of Tiliacea citrago]|uniref:APC family permease n=1 Tax=Alphaproteobacteria bacterium endosymbiont of Tiliacea citrago TaxID=3077944 RepID=UPI00313B41F4